jgi:hypothetical protein
MTLCPTGGGCLRFSVSSYYGTPQYIQVNQSTFNNFQGGSGAALYFDIYFNISINVNSCLFINCTVTGNGKAIYLNYYPINITDSMRAFNSGSGNSFFVINNNGSVTIGDCFVLVVEQPQFIILGLYMDVFFFFFKKKKIFICFYYI